MSDTDLFPETKTKVEEFMVFEGKALDKWDLPRVRVVLLMSWNPVDAWVCGWAIVMDRSGDEWSPLAPDQYKRYTTPYPWYRPHEMARGNTRSLVAAQALRAARIVVEQMLHYMNDEAGQDDARHVSDRMEVQTRKLTLGETAP